MIQKYFETLENDYREARGFLGRLSIRLKLIYYFFQRPLAHLFLHSKVYDVLRNDYFFNHTTRLLLNEGGMFKNYIYKTCNDLKPIRNSVVLVPGVGYGRNLFQLARFGPSKIIAFDLYSFEEEWRFLSEKIRKEFGVDVVFIKGSFDAVPEEYFAECDFIISEAVLEHVKNFSEFVGYSKKFLKKDGIFYASFGPIWYGPGGDHIYWGADELFNHLLLSKEEYEHKLVSFPAKLDDDSCDAVFMIKEGLFSYLKAEEYLNTLQNNGFRIEKLFAKMSVPAMHLLESNPSIADELDKKNMPLFDRYCGGIYLWARLNQHI